MSDQKTTGGSTVAKLVATIGDLPASPATVSAVMGLTSNLESRVEDVCQVLSSDQSLTARVLKLSNSSFYGRSKEVKSLQEAILILGFFTVRSMVIASSAHAMLAAGNEDPNRGKLWAHSFSTSIAARQLAAELKLNNKDEIYIAALLHDIGKLVLMQKFPIKYANLIQRVEEERLSFCQLEQELFGFTHAEVAELLLESWSFPDSLRRAIRDHHDIEGLTGLKTPSMSVVINAANCLAKRLEVGFEDYQPESMDEVESLASLGFEPDDFDRLTQTINEHYLAESRIFEEA